jgi:hypothetical protein
VTYAIVGLDVEPFRALFGLTNEELAARQVVRVTADAPVGYPCRVLLEDAAPGETLLLLNHEYQSAETPYRGRHAIFINEAADTPRRFVDEVPPVLFVRQAISLRAFDVAGMMTDAELVSGPAIEPAILRLLEDPSVAYLHAHNAARGCFAARIERS